MHSETYLHPSQIQRGAVRMQDADLAILHADEVLRVAVERTRLRRYEHAIGADADDEGGTVARHDELVWIVGAHDAQSPRAVASDHGLLGRLLHGASFLLISLADELGDDFRVRLARELVPSRLVNECELAGAVDVWVSVLVCLATVGGPTSVRDADVMILGREGAFSDEFETVGVFSDGRVLCDSLEFRFGCIDLYIMRYSYNGKGGWHSSGILH